MKTLILALVTCVLAIFYACQENAVNQPESSQILKDQQHKNNSIKICCEVKDPRYGICNLNGCVDYKVEIIGETMHPRALTAISIKLHMNSVLCDKYGMAHPEWRIEGRSEDVVYVSEEGILILEKGYKITNRNDVDLLVRYLVTTNGVGLADVALVPLEK